MPARRPAHEVDPVRPQPAPDVLDPILAAIPDFSLPLNDGVLRGFRQDANSEALFGQMSWHFTERYAAIIEDGTITNLAVDESGIEQSACSNILSML